MGEEINYYKILNCDRNNTIEQIKTEYKRLALQYHPDKCDGQDNDGNEEMMSKISLINEAYGILSDPNTREEYDIWLSNGLEKIGISYQMYKNKNMQQSVHFKTNKTHLTIENSHEDNGMDNVNKNSIDNNNNNNNNNSSSSNVNNNNFNINFSYPQNPYSIWKRDEDWKTNSYLKQFRNYQE
eukprot:TRINITY_DN401_c0_g1_i1.p1 TRINITY_DN401_c0_g1~~TRINITY_DN401_c0_g1_i1.p1  ORF type:complete len:183 (-),score=41.80 TRINITY_DN401_c0_g1_i1:342-890(-)